MNTLMVANTILKHFIDRDNPIKNMKLQKLLFFLYGYKLAFNHKNIIDDDFEAWPYGPVCPNVYFEAKKYYRGSMPIGSLLGGLGIAKSLLDDPVFTGIMDTYGGHSDWALSNITHQPDTPWSQTIKDKGIGGIIDEKLVSEFYEAEIKR